MLDVKGRYVDDLNFIKSLWFVDKFIAIWEYKMGKGLGEMIVISKRDEIIRKQAEDYWAIWWHDMNGR
jgi:hypothetical protein